MNQRIVILGAGPTGLGAAHRLGELGHDDWDIFEGSDHVGGLAASVTDDQGFIWDHGGHVMFSHYDYFDRLVEDALRGDYDEHMREAWVWLLGRFVPYPFQNNIHRLPREAFLDCVDGIVDARDGGVDTANFASWIQSVFGEGIARVFMRPYNWKVWAHPLEMMGSRWQGDRVPTVDLRRILDNALEGRDDVSWGPNNKFKFPLLGTGMLYERIAAGLVRPVHLEHDAERIDLDARTVRFRNGASTSFDHLVNTIPLKELVRLLSTCPQEVLDAVQQLRHTSGLFVGIGVRGDANTTRCWMYFPEDDCPFYRVTYLSNYSTKVAPDGHFSLLAEVSSSEFKPENADDVVQRTIDGMRNTGLLTDRQVNEDIVSRQLLSVKYSYPVPALRRDEALAVIQPWLESQGILSRGRFGAWRYEIGNTDHSVMMGVEAADRLVTGEPERTWSLSPGEEAKSRLS